YFDDSYISYYDKDGLAAGSTYTTFFPYTWPSDCDPHTMKVVVDADSDITESNEGNNERSEPFSAICGKDWTFMVYLDGDNNLDDYGDIDFGEMEAVGSSSSVNVVVLKDDSAFGDTHLYYVEGGSSTELYPSWLDSEENMGNGETLRDFVSWAIDGYPADHTFLVIWDHGAAWEGACWDDTSGGDYLTMLEIGDALAGALGGQRLDIVGFADCLMANLAVCHQVGDYADYLVGSEKTGWAYGDEGIVWNFDDIIGYLESHTSASDVAQYVVNNTMDNLTAHMLDESHTWSAMDLAQMDALAVAVSDFAYDLEDSLASHQSEIHSARDATESYEGPSGGQYGRIIDFYHLAQNVYDDTSLPAALRTSAQNVMNAISSAVIAERHHTGSGDVSVDHAHGLSIYFPDEESKYDSDYENLDFPADTHWNEFLATYLDSDPPPPPSPDDGVSGWSNDNTPTFTWPEPSDASGIAGYYWKVDSGSETWTTLRSVTVPAQPDGTHVFYVRAKDNAGNIGAYGHHDFKIDTVRPTNPTNYASDPASGSWTQDNTIYVEWSGATDDLSGIDGYWYRWSQDTPADPTGCDYTSLNSVTSPPLADGTWYLSLRSRDVAGNDGEDWAYCDAWYLDTTPPSNPTSYSSDPPPGDTTDDTIYVEWSGAADNLSGVDGYWYLWSQDAPADPTGHDYAKVASTTSSPLSDGVWYLSMRSRDAAGNNAEGGYVWTGPWNIGVSDTEKPVVTLISPNGGEKWEMGTQHDITWVATDNVGVASVDIYYSTDEGLNWVLVATGEGNDGLYSWSLPSEPSTKYLVKVVAHDAAGNTGDDISNANFYVYPRWDIDRDGTVDYKDLAILGAAYGCCDGDPGYNPDADIDQDGCVDYKDLAILGAHYGEEY
ncbi:MAG: hypothetical protein DRP27_04375, partial [Thermotogae bacterium]